MALDQDSGSGPGATPGAAGGTGAIAIDIAHVARLARLGLGEADLERYRAQLTVILEHAARVQAVDTSGAGGDIHPLGIVNALRPDEVRPSLDRAEVLAAAPAHEDGYFLAPPALEQP